MKSEDPPMPDTRVSNTPEIARAFSDYQRQVTINNVRVGCYLGMALMPAGMVLDLFVYPHKVVHFLQLRLLCSVLIAIFWGVVSSGRGVRYYRALGVVLAMLPSFFMSWMIFETEGAASPYYAGLNLVLLVIGFVLQWTFAESLAAVSLVMAMYVTACVLNRGLANPADLINNLYFITLTGIIVVTGSYVHTRLRFREFALRYELDQSSRLIEESNRKLIELDQLKSRFFANVSHELRTPLTLLLAPLESLIQQTGSAATAQLRDTLAMMRANGMRLLKLINDLLDAVRLESGKMEVRNEPLAVPEFLRGLASAVSGVATGKGLNLSVSVGEELGSVLADRDKLEKVLLNLVFNAIKFTPAGGRIEMHGNRDGDELVLLVRDTGMGIPEEQLPFIFDRFWQADSSSQRKYQGVGIGLSLVKDLTEVQGGTVTVESRVGQGSTFTLRLPWVRAENVPLPEPVETTALLAPVQDEWLTTLYRRAELFPALSPLRESMRPIESPTRTGQPSVLIADDEPDMLRFLKSQLAGHFQVLEAVDGQQAVDKANQFLPDVVVLDMMMPEKDGIQACRELRQHTSTRAIPILLLTARADEETKLAALSAGASDFLTKPFSITEFHVRVKNLADACQFQKRLARQNQILEATIEQLKETEMQLVQTEKLASLGRMSAGIIHEINNPLNYATTGLYTLRKRAAALPPGQVGDITEILADIEEGVGRVKNIVSDLRTFTHPDGEQLDDVDLNEVVSTALRFLSHEWKDEVQIETRLPQPFIIRANKSRLIQVLVNVVQNSLYAVKRKTFEEATERPSISIEGRIETGRHLLIIRDNGEGIAAADLDKVFDPFFTTKEVGKGMGLGLSICYRIVREYEGHIRVESEAGKYCKFSLEFPARAA